MNLKNILVVDDNIDLATCLSILLTEESYEVTVVYNGEDAIAEAGKNHFDLAIIDVKLPGISGVEVFSTLRKISPETQGIMMTGHRVDQLLQEATDNGAVCILRKPFAMEKLIEQLDGLRKKGIVLVADDDPEFSAGMEKFLSEQGYHVLVARTGEEAIERVNAENVDVLVLDLKLPVMHGLDVCINLSKQGHEVPIIIVTGYAAQEMDKIDTLRSMSVTGCLFKPFNPEELLSGIESVLNKQNDDINQEITT